MNYESACRYAWNSTKKSTQPEYDDLIESYRDMLTARAEAVMATKLVDDGPFAAFENAVLNAPSEVAPDEATFVSDQGYEQVTDADPYPIVNDADQSVATIADKPAETVEQMEASRLERKRKRDEAQPKKSPKKAAPKKVAVKKAAKKAAPKPKVVKKGKK